MATYRIISAEERDNRIRLDYKYKFSSNPREGNSWGYLSYMFGRLVITNVKIDWTEVCAKKQILWI